MTMTSGQYLDISYPGSGWLYLGEEDGKQLFRYFGRKIGTTDTSFTLRSRNEGTTLLHFSKTDTLTGDIIDDWLEVTVKGKKRNAETRAGSFICTGCSAKTGTKVKYSSGRNRF